MKKQKTRQKTRPAQEERRRAIQIISIMLVLGFLALLLWPYLPRAVVGKAAEGKDEKNEGMMTAAQAGAVQADQQQKTTVTLTPQDAAMATASGNAALPDEKNTVDYGIYARYCIRNGPDIKQLIAQHAQQSPLGEPTGMPTFDKSITTTAFFIPHCEKDQPWYTGAWDKNQGSYSTACQVPEGQRGFYEEIKCEGIGICGGRQYGPDISKTEGINARLLDEEHRLGETVCGTQPEPHRTIAVNNIPGTPCYIPYGSFVYIKFSENGNSNNPWNGWYVAEHTNLGLQRQCQVDIFIGGKNEYAAAAAWVMNKQSQVWVFPPTGASPLTKAIFEKAIPPREQPIGIYSINPSFRIVTEYNPDEYSFLYNTVVFSTNGLLSSVAACEATGHALDECVSGAVNEINTNLINTDTELSSTPSSASSAAENPFAAFELVDGPCNPEENIKSDLVEEYQACKESQDTDCICDISLKQAAQNSGWPSGGTSKVEMLISGGSSLRRSSPAAGIDQFIATIPAKTVSGLDALPRIEDEPTTIVMNRDEPAKTVSFYKTIDGIAYVRDSGKGNKQACSMTKRTFKFCARKINEMNGKEYPPANAGMAFPPPVEYHFAVTFPQAPIQPEGE